MNVRKMAAGGKIPLTQTLSIPVPAGYGAAEAAVALRGTITKDKTVYLLSGEADAALELECARCLRPVPVKVTFALEERFCETPGEDEFPAADGVIDLEAAVADNLLPRIPAKVLCREDCKGLCHTCGADLNESGCGCQTNVGDERLAVLKQWFSEDTTESI